MLLIFFTQRGKFYYFFWVSRFFLQGLNLIQILRVIQFPQQWMIVVLSYWYWRGGIIQHSKLYESTDKRIYTLPWNCFNQLLKTLDLYFNISSLYKRTTYASIVKSDHNLISFHFNAYLQQLYFVPIVSSGTSVRMIEMLCVVSTLFLAMLWIWWSFGIHSFFY